MEKKLNGFNNGRDTSDGVGGKPGPFEKQMITIKVKEFEKVIEKSIMDLYPFEVDFDGEALLQFTKTKDGLKVINGVDGYGRNVLDEYRNEPVMIY